MSCRHLRPKHDKSNGQPYSDHGGLSNFDYAPLAETMGRVLWSPEAFNCNAPDTGNMEILHMFGTAEQKADWLSPLLEGRTRSAFGCAADDRAADPHALQR